MEMSTPNRVLQAIFDHAAVGIAEISLDGKWLRVNKQYCQMLGYSESELRSRTLKDITHPEDWVDFLDARGQLLEETISPQSIEQRYIRHDGTVFWGRLNRSLVRNDENLPQYFIAVVEDITGKKRAERALKETERRLDLALEAAGLGLWERDLRTGVTLISGEYAKLHGLAADHPPLSHEEWLKSVHPDDRDRVDAQYRESLERTHAWDTEFRLVWPDGSVHWILAKGQVFLDDRGRPVRLAGICLEITERKRAEEQRSQFAAIVESSDLAIVGETLDGTIVSWNSGAETLYGYTAEEVVGRNISLLLPPGPRDRLPSVLERLGRGERIRQVETIRMRKDGHLVPVSLALSPIRSPAGAAVGISAIARDITEQKRVETKLRESEERFRSVADSAPVMIWLSGPDKLCTFFNKPWLDFTGRTLEQELGDGWATGVHPDDLDGCVTTYYSSFDARRNFRMEYRLRRADGEYRWVLDNGLPLYRDREFAGFIGSCIDITELKVIQDRLRASEARLLSAQRLANLGSWERDDATGNTDFSGEMLHILGAPDPPPQTLREFLNYVHPEDRDRVREGAQQARLTGVSMADEYRIVRADGEVRFVRSVLEAIRNERGVVIRVVGATQDITDLKRAQEEAFARQNLESIGTLAAGIAHDFNNILAAVLFQAEVLQGRCDDGAHSAEELEDIRSAALRGSEIVRQLMIYAGKESAVGGSADLSKIVEEMLPLLKVSVSKHAVLEMDIRKDLPAVHAEAGQLRQILMNLVTNASEAIGDRDGVIRVTIRCVGEKGQDSGATSEPLIQGDCVELAVSDTGCGIAPEIRPRVFEPFFTTKSVGHGLGLAVVDGIVRGLGGAIEVTSELRKGTTFQILLPRAETKGQETSRAMPPIQEFVQPSQAAVLIVEDENVLRQAVAKILRKNNFQVLEAADGSSAINLLRAAADKIDLLLLDVTIPGASSTEVIAEAARSRPDIRVILTSAYSQEMLAESMTASQVRGFIRKPFQVADLVQKLRRAASAS
jgi:two-component system cell cycle sensor histidine kinase/response regulator CckA